MMIPKSVYYGIKGLVFLAKEKKPSSVKWIAQQEKIPIFFLEKIFQKLEKNGLIESKKGLKGGFFLALSPQKITLKKIIDALAEEKNPAPCLREEGRDCCDLIEFCRLRRGWKKFYQNLNLVLEKATLVNFLK